MIVSSSPSSVNFAMLCALSVALSAFASLASARAFRAQRAFRFISPLASFFGPSARLPMPSGSFSGRWFLIFTLSFTLAFTAFRTCCLYILRLSTL